MLLTTLADHEETPAAGPDDEDPFDDDGDGQAPPRKAPRVEKLPVVPEGEEPEPYQPANAQEGEVNEEEILAYADELRENGLPYWCYHSLKDYPYGFHQDASGRRYRLDRFGNRVRRSQRPGEIPQEIYPKAKREHDKIMKTRDAGLGEKRDDPGRDAAPANEFVFWPHFELILALEES